MRCGAIEEARRKRSDPLLMSSIKGEQEEKKKRCSHSERQASAAPVEKRLPLSVRAKERRHGQGDASPITMKASSSTKMPSEKGGRLLEEKGIPVISRLR